MFTPDDKSLLQPSRKAAFSNVNSEHPGMSRRSIAAVAAIVILVVLILSMASICFRLGDVGMTAANWFVLLLGVFAILALGIGLVAFVFISDRFGYDEMGASSPQPNAGTRKENSALAVRMRVLPPR